MGGSDSGSSSGVWEMAVGRDCSTAIVLARSQPRGKVGIFKDVSGGGGGVAREAVLSSLSNDV